MTDAEGKARLEAIYGPLTDEEMTARIREMVYDAAAFMTQKPDVDPVFWTFKLSDPVAFEQARQRLVGHGVAQ